MTRQEWLRSKYPVAVILALALLDFWPLVLHPTQTLYSDHSDLLAEHVPAKRFWVRSFQETGQLPLWCPYLFAGSPFVHDIQVAAFYPPHLALLLLPEEYVGCALSWLVVLHLWLAGLGMYAYGRHRGLSELAALTSAIGFMFGGRWMLHLLGGGHYITIGLAWLPLVLLYLERALERRSLAWATSAGSAFALLTLGTHPQWTFYAGLCTAAWTWRAGATRRWLAYGTWAAALAVALAAVQLLPTLEAAKHATRSAGMAPEPGWESLKTLLFLVGPSLMQQHAQFQWEDRGGLSLLWLFVAVLAPVLCRGRTRYEAGVCLAMLVYGVGGAVLVRGLPGFDLFRQSPRVLVVACFPVAYLGGVATQALFASTDACRHALRLLLVVAGCVALLTAAAVVTLVALREPLRWHPYWAAAPVLVVVAALLLRRGLGTPLARRLWVIVLMGDLLWLIPSVEVRPEVEVYAPSECVRFVAGRADGRVLEEDFWDEEGRWVGGPLGQGAPLAPLHGIEALRGYSPLDVLRYRQYLQMVAGADRPLRALDGPLTHPVLARFDVTHRGLLDLLGVRYLLLPAGEKPPGEGWKAVFTDELPSAFNIYLGGRRGLPPYTVYENTHAFPRAFVVGRALALPDPPDRLAAMTSTDLRGTVLLEDAPDELLAPAGDATFTPAVVRRYQPNEVVIETDTTASGFLVLADVWYPGWVCTIDGSPAPVYRANHLFRAVALPAGKHKVVFRFEPASFALGLRISLTALALVIVVLVRPSLRYRGERG